jgi:hypothetical protein
LIGESSCDVVLVGTSGTAPRGEEGLQALADGGDVLGVGEEGEEAPARALGEVGDEARGVGEVRGLVGHGRGVARHGHEHARVVEGLGGTKRLERDRLALLVGRGLGGAREAEVGGGGVEAAV